MYFSDLVTNNESLNYTVKIVNPVSNVWIWPYFKMKIFAQLAEYLSTTVSLKLGILPRISPNSLFLDEYTYPTFNLNVIFVEPSHYRIVLLFR